MDTKKILTEEVTNELRGRYDYWFGDLKEGKGKGKNAMGMGAPTPPVTTGPVAKKNEDEDEEEGETEIELNFKKNSKSGKNYKRNAKGRGKNKMSGSMPKSGGGAFSKNAKKEESLVDRRTGLRKLNESHSPGGFETHVICGDCGFNGDFDLSEKKTMLRCPRCGYTDLTENVVGLGRQA